MPTQKMAREAGRKNTVLFVTAEPSGLCNVHIAACSALLENHPDVEVHYCSFAEVRPRLDRISAAAKVKNPAARSIHWHELPGPNMMETALRRVQADFEHFVMPPGLGGLTRTLESLGEIAAPWTPEEHYALYSQVHRLVDEVDPALVVLDCLLSPAVGVAANMNRRFAFLVPNTTSELFCGLQPWLSGFWKYPTIGSGYPFPVPLRLIPANILMSLRLIVGILLTPYLWKTIIFLRKFGIKKPIELSYTRKTDDHASLLATMPEANLPLSKEPSTVKYFGPTVIDTAPVADQDPKMAAWLKRGPTVMINLGSMTLYTRERAQAMVGAIRDVLYGAAQDVQVLWKMRKCGDYGDDVFDPVRAYMENGRLRIENWLDADPMSLMLTGDIAVSVHHGGAGCYHEALLAGIPQVILPMWLDCYNIARTAEYAGVAVWPGSETAPVWDSRSISEGILGVLSKETGGPMREKARQLAEAARRYGGRDAVAEWIAKTAASSDVSFEWASR